MVVGWRREMNVSWRKEEEVWVWWRAVEVIKLDVFRAMH